MAIVTANGTGSPITVPGLSPGQWNFTVAANNGIGSGPQSSSGSATITGSPTTGPLYQRCSFGLYSNGGTSGQTSMENEVANGSKFKRYVTYQLMQNNGSSGFPQSDADWCKSTGHTLDIAWQMNPGQPTYAMLVAGQADASIDAFSQACIAHGNEIIMRMWWEMNLNGNDGNLTAGNFSSPTQWIAGWRYVYNRIRVHNGATNVKFFWCCNYGDVGPYTLEQCFPGTAYVQQVGFDVYNNPAWNGSWQTFTQVVTNVYNRVAALDSVHPMGIGETGSTADSSNSNNTLASWMQSMFTCTAFPQMRYINMFNQPPWNIDATPAAIAMGQQYFPLAPQDVLGILP